ncbi:MAG TPA: Ig-like domain-containing protein, partial [bacterium]|nr:Ig-like domain-containing protein [bacterium]
MSTVTKKLAFAALAFALAGSLNAAVQFIHTPVLSGPAGEDLDIQAALMGADNISNIQTRLYFRQRGVELYSSVVMGGPSSSLDASIPGAQVGTAGVEYYIEADSFSGGGKTVVATYPANNPSLNPVEVVVRRDLSAPAVTPLSPADGESVDSSMPVISASFDDPAGAINLTSVVVKMDGRAVSSDGLEVYDTIVTYIPPSALADGTHKVTVTVTNKAGHTGSATWSFVVGASASQNVAQVRQPWVVDGSLTLETQYGDVLLHPLRQTTGLPFRPYGANQGTLAVNARGPEDTVSLKVYDTDMNRSDQQPLDRYNLTWTNRDGYLAVGDVSPSFSELSLFDLYELRGFDFNLLSGPAEGMHTRFEGVWGQTESGINGGAGDLTNTLSSPTYAQYLYGWRWEVGSPFFKWGFNGVTINDDVNSISNPEGIEPDYNTMFTSDVTIGLPFAWLTLSGEAGVDYFASDQTLTGLSAGSAYKAGAVWDALPLGSKLTFE